MRRSSRPRRTRPARKPPTLRQKVYLVRICTAVAFGITVLLGAESGVQHGQYVRSQRVQHDGIRLVATVESAHVDRFFHKYSSPTYRTTLKVLLDRPVKGQQKATVRVAARSSLTSGERSEVALDPRDSSYAELVGRPYRTPSAWIDPLIGAAILLVAGAVSAVANRRWTIQWRAERAASSSA
ncbi:MAG: hypothetical protein ABI345_05055 [Jatrophihabitans sp.]